MTFEIRGRDILARIGRLETKGGTIETPLFLPVINPVVQPIQPRMLYEEFDCKALITTADIIKKHFKDETIQKGIRKDNRYFYETSFVENE